MSQQQQRPRQDPVSCESCRKKKLKCSREQPCSNCVARGITCEFSTTSRLAPQSPSRTAAAPSKSHELSCLRSENAAIKARLERLEEIIYSNEPDNRPTKVRRHNESEKSATTLPSPSDTTGNTPDTEKARKYKGDFQWLEGVGIRENTRLPHLSLPFVTRVVSFDDVVQYALLEGQKDRFILLPSQEIAMSIVDTYIEQLDPLQHVIHIPTVKRNITALYNSILQQDPVDPNRSVLLLSMLTSIVYFWGLGPCQNQYIVNGHTAIKVAALWLRNALDILEHVKRCAAATLETVQAGIVVLFLIFHIEGFSPKVRAMLFAAIAAAKELCLHRTDDASISLNATSRSESDKVDKEVRRRIWWHLACTDWSLAISGGPDEGTYSISPHHMRVKPPRNVSDAELESMPSDFQHPLSEPTIMAYTRYRLRLAEICREVADHNWARDVEDVAVDDMLRLDAKFDALFADLPVFLRLDEASRMQSAHLEEENVHIRLQRYVFNMAGHAKRCKYHLPFLLRASVDANYAFSREACLRAARNVIQIREHLVLEPGTLWIANSRLSGVLHIFFYAIIVLVMDLCVNRGSDCDTARKEEIQRACKALEEAKAQSTAAGMFLDSLLAILRKHSIRLQREDQIGEMDVDHMSSSETGNASTSGLVTVCPRQRLAPVAPASIDGLGNPELDEIWKSYIDLESSIDPLNWDALINDIENFRQDNETLGRHITSL